MPFDPIENFDLLQLPDTGEQSTFHANAQYVFEHLATAIVPGFNDRLAALQAAMAGDVESLVDSLIYMTENKASGPADYDAVNSTDALVILDSGLQVPALKKGMRFGFTPTIANAGAFNVQLDGGAVVAAKTQDGRTPPANYMRAGVPVSFVFDGTDCLFDRAPEYVVSAAGETWRGADGLQICSALYDNVDINQTMAALYWSSGLTKNLPATFVGSPVGLGNIQTTGTAWVIARVTATDWAFAGVSPYSRTDDTARLIAIGRWF